MNCLNLRIYVRHFMYTYGSSVTFLASNIGVTREHLSRWLNNENYVISTDLKLKIIKLLKENDIL
jgi:plasmid maintenance system antidote protein VapI